MAFLLGAGSQLGAAGAGGAGGATATAGTAGALTGFDKFMNLAAFAMSPDMQSGFVLDKFVGGAPSTGDFLDDITQYTTSGMDQGDTLRNFFQALDSRKKRQGEQNAGF